MDRNSWPFLPTLHNSCHLTGVHRPLVVRAVTVPTGLGPPHFFFPAVVPVLPCCLYIYFELNILFGSVFSSFLACQFYFFKKINAVFDSHLDLHGTYTTIIDPSSLHNVLLPELCKCFVITNIPSSSLIPLILLLYSFHLPKYTHIYIFMYTKQLYVLHTHWIHYCWYFWTNLRVEKIKFLFYHHIFILWSSFYLGIDMSFWPIAYLILPLWRTLFLSCQFD